MHSKFDRSQLFQRIDCAQNQGCHRDLDFDLYIFNTCLPNLVVVRHPIRSKLNQIQFNYLKFCGKELII